MYQVFYLALIIFQRDSTVQENETRIGDLEKQLAEIKQTSQNTEYEKEQQITRLKADLEKVQKLLHKYPISVKYVLYFL